MIYKISEKENRTSVFCWHTFKLRFCDNDVVKKTNTQYFPRFHNLTGDDDICFRWLRNARWMIMRKNHGRSGIFQSWPENLTRVNDIRGQAPDGYHLIVN